MSLAVLFSFAGVFRLPTWRRELYKRQPALAKASELFLLASIPCLFAMFVDPRTLEGVSVWLKPMKFLISLSVYYATLGWLFGYLPTKLQRRRLGYALICIPIIVGVLEMSWLITAAIYGVPSHFNDTNFVWQLTYILAGLGAVALVTVILIQGILISRNRDIQLPGAFRLALVLGCVIASLGTLLVANYIGVLSGPVVGAISAGDNTVPFFGWARSAGDLRVAHFWALHAHQLIPLAGWFIVNRASNHAYLKVCVLSMLYVGLVLGTFIQALQGQPFIG